MIAATVLAAGHGVRFGDQRSNKLLEDFAGRPLVMRAVEAALGSRANRTVVVTGWDNERVRPRWPACQSRLFTIRITRRGWRPHCG